MFFEFSIIFFYFWWSVERNVIGHWLFTFFFMPKSSENRRERQPTTRMRKPFIYIYSRWRDQDWRWLHWNRWSTWYWYICCTKNEENKKIQNTKYILLQVIIITEHCELNTPSSFFSRFMLKMRILKKVLDSN